MLRAIKKVGFSLLVFGCLCVSSGAAQDLGDLGSSSGIFRSPNPKTSNKTKAPAKTAAAKRKSAPKTAPVRNAVSKPIRTNAAKNARTKLKPAGAKNGVENKTQTAETAPNNLPSEDVIITIGKKTPATVDESLEEAIERGNAARDERNYAAAEKEYRRAQSLRPRDSRAIYGLGNIFSDQQRWEDAEKSYRQAIALEPNNAEAYIALSFVLTQPVAGMNLSERYAEAEKAARRAIELDAGSPVAYDQLGVSLELGGGIGSETQESYRTAIKLDPEFALAYAHLGRLLRRNGLTKESTAAYGDAIRLAADVPTMILVADVMQSQQRFSESEQLLRRALRDDPKNPTALFLLGRALTTAGKFDEAEMLLKKSLEISPNSFIAYIQLTSLYARRGNYAEAERILMKAVRIVSVNEKKRLAQELEVVGDGFMRLGRKTDAARVYRQAISFDSEKTDLADKLTAAQKS